MTYSGVFILSDMVTRDLNGEGQPLSQVYVKRPDGSTANVGYWGGGTVGGGSPGRRSLVDKCTFTTDTTQNLPGSPISSARYAGAATGNSSQGYFVGGFGPSFSSSVDKMTYADETVANVPGSPMTVARSNLACSTSGTAGYFSGGQWPRITTTDRLTFASDTMAEVPGAALTGFRYRSSGASSSTAGYLGGGYNPPNEMSSTEKITFAAETYAVVATAQLSSPRRGTSASGNSTQAYFCGGSIASPGGPETSVDKLTFSNDTTANAANAGLSVARRGASGTGNSSNGYIAGGEGASPTFSTTDKINYSNDTTAVAANAALSAGRMYTSGVGSKLNALPGTQTFDQINFSTGQSVPPTYAAGGMFGTTGPWSGVSSNDKIDLTTETQSVGNPFNYATGSGGAVTDGQTAGYIGGGRASGANMSNVGKMTYATDTSERIPNNCTTQRRWCDGLSSPSAGYFLGGNSLSSTDKLTYSSGAVAGVPNLNLNPGGQHNSATFGLSDRGYRIFGQSPSSAGQRINYATDTFVRVPSLDAPISPARSACSGHQSPTDGYALGGARATYVSTVNRINFATETNITAKPLAAAAGYVGGGGGTRTSAYLYGGGSLPNPSTHTFIHRYEMATETASLLANTFLQSTRYCVGNLTSGHGNGLNAGPVATPTPQTFTSPGDDTSLVAGGYTPSTSPGRSTSIQKMNLSTETVTNSTAQFSNGNHAQGSSTGNGTYAFFTSGVNDSTSATERVTYATDAIQRMPGMNTVNDPVYGATPVGNTTLGYMMGGAPPNRSYVQKLDFSAESLAAVPGANMPAPRRYGNNAATPAFGYAIQGQDQTPNPDTFYTDAVKLTYSSESSSLVPGGTIPTTSGPIGCGPGISGPAHAYITLNVAPYNSSTTIYKFTFSNETAAASPTAELLTPGTKSGGAGDHTAGYFFGGTVWGGSPAAESNINKITYSNDTCSTSPGKLAPARQSANARSMSMNGMPAATVSNPVNC